MHILQKDDTYHDTDYVTLEDATREIERWKSECKRQWKHLSQARHNARAIQNIRWGSDGDCGADRLANLIEEDCDRGMMISENAESSRASTESES